MIALLEGAFADIARRGPAGPARRRPASPPGKVRTLDEVYGWDQALSQGLLVDVEHATARAGCRCPGRRCGSSTPGADGETETTRRDHTAPPVLGADGDAIRAWLTGARRRAAARRRRRRGRARHVSAPPAGRPRAARPGPRPGLLDVVGLPRAAARRSPTTYAARAGGGGGEDPAGRVDHHRRGQLRGRRVAVVAGEFGFLAGSIGVAAAERLIAAVERATEEGLPLLAAPVSGGTRMQEGTVAFLQMIGITAAIARHKEAGLPYLVYLRSPTFGGVLASWGSLGHVTIAEPGAAIGFLGPRVYEALYGEPFPEGVQTAENLAERGLIDAVVPHEEIADVADRALRVLAARQTWHRDVARRRAARPPEDGTDADDPEDGRTAWDVVTASRRPDRPGVRRLLRTAATDVVGLQRHRRRREGPRAAAGAGPVRRGAVRGARPGPARAVAVGAAGPGGAARGPARHAPGRRAAAAAGHPDRHPGRRAVPGGRGGRAGRGDRPLPARPGDAPGAHAGGAARARAPAAGRWRWCRPTGCWPRPTAGWARCRRRAPRRSCTATVDHAGEMAAVAGRAGHRPVAGRDRRPGGARAARRRRRAGRVLPAAGPGARRGAGRAAGPRRRRAVPQPHPPLAPPRPRRGCRPGIRSADRPSLLRRGLPAEP